MRFSNAVTCAVDVLALLTLTPAPATAQKKPNIVFIMGDDVGWFNIGASGTVSAERLRPL